MRRSEFMQQVLIALAAHGMRNGERIPIVVEQVCQLADQMQKREPFDAEPQPGFPYMVNDGPEAWTELLEAAREVRGDWGGSVGGTRARNRLIAAVGKFR